MNIDPKNEQEDFNMLSIHDEKNKREKKITKQKDE